MAAVECEILDLGCHYNNTIDQLKQFFLYCWDQILQGALYLLNLVPVPSWATEGGPVFGNIPPSAAFFMQVFEINFGLTVLGSAFLTRFIIRRLPVVG